MIHKGLRAAFYGLYAAFLYLGLPLLGWGVGDVRGFFSSTPRSTYAAAVVLLGLGVAYQFQRFPDSFGSVGGRSEKRVARQTITHAALSLSLLLGMLFLPFADRRGIAVVPWGEGMRWVGSGLAAVGMALIYLSGYYLGRMYSPEVTIQEGHQLITAGPYRWLRHPRYAGAVALTVGGCLLFRSWLVLLATPLVLAAVLFRIHDEEAMMAREFGAEWEAYCRRTWRLLPGVY